MNKIMKVGLLSLVAIVQASMIIGGFMTYWQMNEMLSYYMYAYKHLVEETGGPIIDFVPVLNPFAPFFLFGLLGLFSTFLSLIDEIRNKNTEN